MLLRKLLTLEPELNKTFLAGLRDPLWTGSLISSQFGTDYDVKITDESTQYSMLVPGRDEEEITLEIVNGYLTVKAPKKEWLPSLHFQFGVPSKRDSISAELKDGVLTVTIVNAKESTASGKIKITKS